MAITMTTTAAKQVRQMAENSSETPVVRLGVNAGGCSGFSYALDIVEQPNGNDRVFECNGVQLVCDPKSYLYLNGTEVDFSDEMMGGGFKFDNPNVSRSCGCGTSFSA